MLPRNCRRHWLKELASENILSIKFTLDTFQLLSGWLKELAPLNIRYISVTLDTFHLSSGWLKEHILYFGHVPIVERLVEATSSNATKSYRTKT